MFQVAIVLSTGKLNGTQIFSLITSVMSLSWGAARSFLILRPADKADPDPELMTVSLRIWPYVLDLGCSRSTRLERDLANCLRLFLTLFDWIDNLFCRHPPDRNEKGILKSKYVRMPYSIPFHKFSVICKLFNFEI